MHGLEWLKGKGNATTPPRPPPPPLLSILGLGRWQANGRASLPVTPHPSTDKTLEKKEGERAAGSFDTQQHIKTAAWEQTTAVILKPRPGSRRKKHMASQSQLVSAKMFKFLFVEWCTEKEKLKTKSVVTLNSSMAWVLSVRSNDLSSLLQPYHWRIITHSL